MSESVSPRIARVKRELRVEELQCVPAPLGYRSCLHDVGILSRQFEGTESEKPNGHQSGNMGEKTEDRYTVRFRVCDTAAAVSEFASPC
jgi:hypothetical protein